LNRVINLSFVTTSFLRFNNHPRKKSRLEGNK